MPGSALLPCLLMHALDVALHTQRHVIFDRGLEFDKDQHAHPLGGSLSRGADLEAPRNVPVAGLQPSVDGLGRERFQSGEVDAPQPLSALLHVGEHETDQVLHRLSALGDSLGRAVPIEPGKLGRDGRLGLT